MKAKFARNGYGKLQIILDAENEDETLLVEQFICELRAPDAPRVTAMDLSGMPRRFTLGCYEQAVPLAGNWPTEHEADCARSSLGTDCGCPMGNL